MNNFCPCAVFGARVFFVYMLSNKKNLLSGGPAIKYIIEKNLVKGILECGVDVIRLGLVTTPMYYYSWDLLDIHCGIMVTASHNPKDDNGFKFSFDESGNVKGKDISDFYDFTVDGQFANGIGRFSKYDIVNDYLELYKMG